VADRDRVAVVTEQAHALVTKANEVAELAGPGRGVTVIKVTEGDKVIAFLVTSKKDAEVSLETSKGRKLELTAFGHDPVARGGRGHQLVKRDTVKALPTPPVFVQLPPPEEKK
jgi:DNA gyrase subunit A